MWKFMRLGLVLILPSIIMGLNLRVKEKIYIDVLKNITRVNNMLHDLLENYKKLKLDYESHARPENKLSTEVEHDDESEDNDAVTVKYRMKTTKKMRHDDYDFYTVTQIMSDDEYQDSSDKSHERGDSKETHKTTAPIKSEENLHSSDTDSNKDDPKDDKMFLEDTEYEKHKDTPENILIGTALKYMKKVIPKHESKKKSKTRFEVLKKAKNGGKDKLILRTENVGNRKTVDNNQPGHKTMMVLLNTELDGEKDRDTENYPYPSDSDNTEDETLRREHIILRDAYGDACLKVAVRKCFKTLLNVRKVVCSTEFKCKTSFKEHFQSHSKTSCIKEFTIHHNNKDNDNKDTSYEYEQNRTEPVQPYRGPKKKKANAFDDITRSVNKDSYFDICLPVMMSEVTTELKPNSTRLQYPNPNGGSINILRDEYERRCRSMSKAKCIRACQYAASATCRQHTCVRAQMRAFRRTCRRECKQAFLSRDTDTSDSSDTDSDGDSDVSDYSDSDGSYGDSFDIELE